MLLQNTKTPKYANIPQLRYCIRLKTAVPLHPKLKAKNNEIASYKPKAARRTPKIAYFTA
jgi:hypothetical protein